MNERKCRLILPLIFFFVLLIQQSFAVEVNNASVLVIETQSNKPLADAIVKITSLDKANRKAKELLGITDRQGNFSYSFTEPVIVQISHLGYTTIF